MSRNLLQSVMNFLFVLLLQTKRISGSDALSHPYLDEGRLRYHTCMCQCCYSVPSGRVYTRDFEPVAERPFSHSYENSLLSVWQGKGRARTALTPPLSPASHLVM